MNARMNHSLSSTTHDRFKIEPEEWHLYHTLYRQARSTWSEVPFQKMAEWINKRQDYIVADFGCGEALLSKAVKNKVFNFDHVAIDDTVTACDMASTGLDDESIDVVVFSLSLMGSNWQDYLKEAHRVLKPDKFLKIAETASRWEEDKLNNLLEELRSIGFGIMDEPCKSFKFIYINAVKKI